MSEDKFSLRSYVNVFVPLLIYAGVSLFAEMIIVFVISFRYALSNSDMTNIDINELTDMVDAKYMDYGAYISIGIALVCIPIFVYLYLQDKKKDEAYENIPLSFYVVTVIMGILACICFSNFVDMIDIEGFIKLFPEEAGNVNYVGNKIVIFVATAICSPVLEELLFRGLLYGRIRRFGWGYVSSSIVICLIFASLHGSILQAIYAFLIGMLFCYIYEKSKHIMAPVIMHLSANIFAFLANEFNWLAGMYEMDKMYFVFLNAMLFFVLALIGRFIEMRFELKTIDRSEEE